MRAPLRPLDEEEPRVTQLRQLVAQVLLQWSDSLASPETSAQRARFTFTTMP
jgi:hypothetical protein